ncbi:hypothetical protein LJC58_07615 [Lachnospiraceae bacterium OttesenSCG-928-D06]|nr:hypothetical protein [Lachnospiraceae bacterium OttesenSCG-928-D06]
MKSKMVKKMLMVLMVSALLIPQGTSKVYAETSLEQSNMFRAAVPTVTVTNETQLQDAIDNANGKVVIDIAGNISLSEGIIIDGAGKDILLRSTNGSSITVDESFSKNGFMLSIEEAKASVRGLCIDGGEWAYLVSIDSDGTLELGDGAILTKGASTLSGRAGGVTVYSGSLVMNPGSLLTECKSGKGKTSGGVYLEGEESTFYMNGGSITDCIAESDKDAVTSEGGGVYAGKGAIFQMNGGDISNCEASHYGGGVSLNDEGTLFVMNGGAINGCKANSYGGGVFLGTDAVFNMYAGSIAGCEAQIGGGVCVLSAGKCVIAGGVIEHNKAAWNGGGFSVNSDAELTFNGGRIADNEAENEGTNIYLHKGRFYVTGNISVQGIRVGGMIYIKDLDSSSRIEIEQIGGNVAYNESIIVKGWDNYVISATDLNYFSTTKFGDFELVFGDASVYDENILLLTDEIDKEGGDGKEEDNGSEGGDGKEEDNGSEDGDGNEDGTGDTGGKEPEVTPPSNAQQQNEVVYKLFSTNQVGDTMNSWDMIYDALNDLEINGVTLLDTDDQNLALLKINIQHAKSIVDERVIKKLSGQEQVAIHFFLGGGDAVTFYGDRDLSSYSETSFAHTSTISKEGEARVRSVTFLEPGGISAEVKLHFHLEGAVVGETAKVYKVVDGKREYFAEAIIQENSNICFFADRKDEFVIVY